MTQTVALSLVGRRGPGRRQASARRKHIAPTVADMLSAWILAALHGAPATLINALRQNDPDNFVGWTLPLASSPGRIDDSLDAQDAVFALGIRVLKGDSVRLGQGFAFVRDGHFVQDMRAIVVRELLRRCALIDPSKGCDPRAVQFLSQEIFGVPDTTTVTVVVNGREVEV
jgi:hypothetical protein